MTDGTNDQYSMTNDQNNTQSSQPQDQTRGQTLVQFPSAPPLKEQEPFPAKQLVPEVIAPSEQPVEIEPELEQAGVSESAPAPIIPEEVKQAGVIASQPAPAVVVTPVIKTPIDPVKAQKITKGWFLFKNPSSSLLWLAMLVLRQLRLKEKEQTHAN
jgi:hypothetical protein